MVGVWTLCPKAGGVTDGFSWTHDQIYRKEQLLLFTLADAAAAMW